MPGSVGSFCIPSWLHVRHCCQGFLQIYSEKSVILHKLVLLPLIQSIRHAQSRAGWRERNAATLALRWKWNEGAHNFGIWDLLACPEYHEGHWLFFKPRFLFFFLADISIYVQKIVTAHSCPFQVFAGVNLISHFLAGWQQQSSVATDECKLQQQLLICKEW